jgi:trimeric autotransporter adhesin
MRSPGSIRLILALAVVFSPIALSAQTATDATATTIQVPRLIRINGVLAEPPAASGNSSSIDSRSVDLAFSLYSEEAGGEPLWQETQRVEVDATGHYSALLGSTQPEGLPTELFKSAQAQWLGVARQGEEEQPRIMLVSVPFALKAGDAETLGGKPASAFAPSVPREIAPEGNSSGTSIGTSNGVGSQSAGSSEPHGLSNAHALAITGAGTANYLTMWSTASALASSPVYEGKTTHNLGIGTTAPAAALEVVNNTETPLLAQTSDVKLNAIQGINLGTTAAGAGVYGKSSTASGSGVYGTESGTDAVGVWGVSSAATGNGNGVYGVAASPDSYAAGVWGHASGAGANGTVGSCSGTDGCTGVWGYSTGTTGSGWGVYGQSMTGPGVAGETSASGGDALWGKNKATTGYSNGLYVDTASLDGVGAWIDNAAGGYILVGAVKDSGTHMFHVDGSGNGLFAGSLHVDGTVSSAAVGVKIDDPIDPANKVLSHSYVESPDMMSVYNGNITTDEKGLATVALPDYFETLNRDFRYQLTVMGQFAQAIVDKEIAGNRFVIRTSSPNVKVSWQVTGIRQDPWANAHRVATEEEKPAKLRGYYLHPELYGAAEDRSINARNATPSPETLHPDSKRAKPAIANLRKGTE